MNELLIEERLAAHGSHPGSRSYLPRLGDCPGGLSAGPVARSRLDSLRGSSVSLARSSRRDCCFTPDAAVRVVPARLLLLCLLLRSSWLTVEGGRQIGAAGVLDRRGGRAALAVSVNVAVGVPMQSCRDAWI
jgi:hypothetical protein